MEKKQSRCLLQTGSPATTYFYFSSPNDMELLIQSGIYAEEIMEEIQPTPTLRLKSSLTREAEA